MVFQRIIMPFGTTAGFAVNKKRRFPDYVQKRHDCGRSPYAAPIADKQKSTLVNPQQLAGNDFRCQFSPYPIINEKFFEKTSPFPEQPLIIKKHQTGIDSRKRFIDRGQFAAFGKMKRRKRRIAFPADLLQMRIGRFDRSCTGNYHVMAFL